jgi:hypothetical protein
MKLPKFLLALSLLFGLAVTSYAQSVTPQAANKPMPVQDVTLKDVDAKDAIRSLARAMKLNVVFDESVRIQNKLDLELHEVTQEAALKIIFIQQRLRASWIEDNTIYVYADTPQNRQRFEEYKLWGPRANPGK